MVLRDEKRDSIVAAAQAAIAHEFIAAHPGSAEHHGRAVGRFPGGVTHDGRFADPFQLCIDRAEGAWKWDVDGNRYVDYVMGHGSLLLGHNHPEVIGAVSRQLARGTHLGGNHALELAWAERVCAIMPGAEKVRFTSSGTEATMLAVRLARAWTGRTRIVQFKDHFHGWGDTVMGGHGLPGLPAALQSVATVVPCGDQAALSNALAGGDVAVAIVETSNAGFYGLPNPAGFLRFLREETARHGTLLLFDEVVSGFRWSPGGAQQFYGVHGDLTALAKILAGGLPGGAVAGRADVLNVLSFDPAERQGRPKVGHPGTYNANPLSAAAGEACLSIVADSAIQERAAATAATIRSGLNGILRREGVPGCAYGEASMFRIAIGGEDVPPAGDLRAALPGSDDGRNGMPASLYAAFNQSMLQQGIALFGGRGIVSIAHSPEDVDATVSAFGETLARLEVAKLVSA